MKWFGKSWGAPICDIQHVDAPTGKVCIDCARDIQEDDQGLLIPFNGGHQPEFATSTLDIDGVPHLAYHLDCLLKSLGVR